MENPIDKLFSSSEQYIRTTIELYRLKTIRKSADVASTLLSSAIIFLFFSLFMVTVSLGMAIFLGELFNSSYCGYFIVSGFFGLLAVILYLFRNSLLKRPFRRSLINQILK